MLNAAPTDYDPEVGQNPQSSQTGFGIDNARAVLVGGELPSDRKERLSVECLDFTARRQPIVIVIPNALHNSSARSRDPRVHASIGGAES